MRTLFILTLFIATVDRVRSAAPMDDRFAWIVQIEKLGGVHHLEARTYFIDRQYKLPDDTEIIGAGAGGGNGTTTIVAVATKPAQATGRFHGCGPNHLNRVGFVLGSRCRIARLHYVGMERARYPDSHPLCGGAPFETPGCATAYCDSKLNSSFLVGGGGAVRDSIVEDVTIAGGTVQNGFWMPETPGPEVCENITLRGLVVLGGCAQPGPCPSGGTWADGVNIHGAHRNVRVIGNTIHHTGDDGFALWSQGSDESGVLFIGNSAASPRYPRTWLASCFAMYGGRSGAFINNSCAQTGERGAIYFAAAFGGKFENDSFVQVAGNNFSDPGKQLCGLHGLAGSQAPGCNVTKCT